ncbi:MAG: D-alanine--D-alanine ligase [Planctomycetes bacterium]|nr:D-alanine--D-alanine ligase [Planctomycetota bacterium]
MKSDFSAHPDGPEDRFEEYDSEGTVGAIFHALESNGYRARRLGGGRRFVEEALRKPPDLVFNIAEGFGTRSREAHVPSVCEMLRIPYTHSDPLTCAVTLEKAEAKRVVASHGIPTPRFAVVERPEQAEDLPLSFPVISKPLWEGSSMGIRRTSRATDPASLAETVGRLVGDYGQPVLVEEFCSGPEFTVGILGDGRPEAIAVMEIVPRVDRPEEFVYSLEVKRNYKVEVEYRVPPGRPRELLRAVEDVALGAYRALGCRDVGRVDIRVGADGEPKFLEVNPLPGLNPVTSDIVILAGKAGMPYNDLIGKIVENARRRLSI